MTRGMTKPVCLQFENLAIAEITKVLGEPIDTYNDGGSCLQWSMPYGETGIVKLALHCDSKEVGNVYRASWLHSRLDDRQRHVGEDGYTKPISEIEGGWPFPFTYPSGKYNLHPGYTNTLEQMHMELATLLYCISAPGSREKEAFGNIKFEINNG